MNYVENLFDIKDRIYIVTGGGGLLCGEMARGLAKAGAKVVVADARLEKAKAVAEEIVAAGGSAIGLAADVTKRDHWVQLLEQTLAKFSRVDGLINGAGINSPSTLFEITEDSWDQIFAVNMKGTLLGCQVIGKHLCENGGGGIINISSTAAEPPLSKAFAYSASKSGVRNLTQNVARELAPFNVRVNSLRPGFFPTEWNQKNFITPERRDAIWGHTPMKRYGEPKELVGSVIYLFSDAASFVTGADMRIDGGFAAMTI